MLLDRSPSQSIWTWLETAVGAGAWVAAVALLQPGWAVALFLLASFH